MNTEQESSLSSEFSLRNKVAVVTGAASGIGFAIASEFARQGITVIISDVREAAAADAASTLQSAGYRAEHFCSNAAEESDVAALMGFAVDRFGHLDIVINNAGMQHVADIEHFPTEKFEQMIRLMLVGPFLSIKHALPAMKRQQWRRIINIASINGLVGFAGKAAYNSAKHGLIGLTKVAALETAESGITVNALCPGYVDTPLVRNQMQDLANSRGVALERVLDDVLFPLVPQKRLLSSQEIADYAVFLASHQARGITGQAVVIDGGYTAQ